MDPRVLERIDGVYGNLVGWLEGLHGNARQPTPLRVYQNARPKQETTQRLHHHWVILGEPMWERAELSLHAVNPGENLMWTNVREFQRDIMTWVRIWQECIYYPPGCVKPVKLDQVLSLLIDTLHSCSGAVEVATQDVSEELFAVWIRLKQFPDSYAVMASIPKHASPYPH